MGKPIRQLCLILVLGLVIGLPGLASVSQADLVGPEFGSSISWGWGNNITSYSEGTISHDGSVITIHPTSIDVTNLSPNGASSTLTWTSSGLVNVNLSFDYTIAIGSDRDSAIVSVNEAEGRIFEDLAVGTHHFSATFTQQLWTVVWAQAWGNSQVTISNLSISEVSAVPLPGAVFLFGSGLLRLAHYRRRKLASHS